MAGCSFAPLSALSTVELTLPLEDSQPLHLIFVLNSENSVLFEIA